MEHVEILMNMLRLLSHDAKRIVYRRLREMILKECAERNIPPEV